MSLSGFAVAIMSCIALVTVSSVAFVHALMQALGFFPAVFGAGGTKASNRSGGTENERSFLHGMV